MPEHPINTSEIIRLLPQPLQKRFYSLGNYVEAAIEEQEESKRKRLKREDISYIQLAVFVYSLNWLLREGTKAAQRSIEVLEDFGAAGFNVGSVAFRKDNENTLLGRRLAEKLIQSLENTSLLEHVRKAKSISALIKNLRDELSRE